MKQTPNYTEQMPMPKWYRASLDEDELNATVKATYCNIRLDELIHLMKDMNTNAKRV